MIPFWIPTSGPQLAQGDLLPECSVPILPASFGDDTDSLNLEIQTTNIIVVTQSCDLANAKTGLVALCAIYSLDEYAAANTMFLKKGAWEEVRKGRREGLHLLASPTDPENGRSALVVDFRVIHSLPYRYLAEHAKTFETRWRLDSPYLEHFSEAVARFFMRVGLPSSVTPITDS